MRTTIIVIEHDTEHAPTIEVKEGSVIVNGTPMHPKVAKPKRKQRKHCLDGMPETSFAEWWPKRKKEAELVEKWDLVRKRKGIQENTIALDPNAFNAKLLDNGRVRFSDVKPDDEELEKIFKTDISKFKK